MPLLVATVVAARRGRGPSTIVIPVDAPSLWQMVAEELAIATRALVDRLMGRHNGPQGSG